MIKKCQTGRIKYKYCECFLEYTNFKDDLIGYKCLCCSKKYQQKFDENLEERLFNTHKYSNNMLTIKLITITMIKISLSYYCEKVFILM